MPIIPQGFAQGASVEAEVNTRAMRTVARPQDYSRYSSNVITAVGAPINGNLAAASGLFSMIYGGDYTALVKRITIDIQSYTTGFTPGVMTLQLFFARFAGAAATGGISVQQGLLNPHDGKLRTRMRRNDFDGISVMTAAQKMVTSGAALTLPAGLTNSLDANPLASISIGVPGPANSEIVASGVHLWRTKHGEHPIVLGMQDGLVVRATPSATGSWTFNATIRWDEVPVY